MIEYFFLKKVYLAKTEYSFHGKSGRLKDWIFLSLESVDGRKIEYSFLKKAYLAKTEYSFHGKSEWLQDWIFLSEKSILSQDWVFLPWKVWMAARLNIPFRIKEANLAKTDYSFPWKGWMAERLNVPPGATLSKYSISSWQKNPLELQ